MTDKNRDSLLTPSTPKAGYLTPRNLTIYAVAIVFAALAIAFFWKSAGAPSKAEIDHSADQARASQEAATNAPSLDAIETIARNQTDDSRKAEEDAAKKAEEERKKNASVPVNIPTPFPGGGPVSPPAGAPSAADEARAAEAGREALIRSSKILAIEDSGQPSANGPAVPERDRASDPNSPLDPFQRLARAMPNMGAQIERASAPAPSAAQQDREWLKEAGSGNRREISRPYAPPSTNMIMQGHVINAVMVNAINSDLPGEVVARVTMDVYDSIQGDKLLIPKGTKLIAPYSSDIRVGQERLMIAFNRLIMPNGLAVDLPGTMAMDGAGRSGVEGTVDNHYGQMFYVSLLTALGAHVTWRTQPPSGSVTVNAGANQPNGAAQIFTDMNKAVIERNKAMAPTIRIPAGERITLTTSRDMELPVYQKRNY